MPWIQEGLNDDDSSSDGSALSIDDFNAPVPSLVPSQPSHNVILNINQLPSIDVDATDSIDPFNDHLQEVLNMDSDDPTDFDNANYHSRTVPSHSPVYVDTSDDTNYLNNLSVPHVTELQYWDDFFTLDDPDLRILAHSVLCHASEFCINANNIQDTMHPIWPRITRQSDIDYESKRPFFGWIPVKTIKRTFDHCTQHMRLPPSTNLQKHLKSPNPGANIFHCWEPDATDMIHSNTPAICGKETQAQIFVGLVSHLTDVYKAKIHDSTCFLAALQDRVRTWGAPTKLIADNASLYQSWSITHYLCDIWARLWQCESKFQHQNYAEYCYCLVKRITNCMMDCFGCLGNVWFLYMEYVCFILNRSVNSNIGGGSMTPLMLSCFEISDISPLLVFTFWQPV